MEVAKEAQKMQVKGKIEWVRWVPVVWLATVGIAASDPLPAKIVRVPTEKYAAFDIPSPGADLILFVVPDNRPEHPPEKEMVDSKFKYRDENDSVMWWKGTESVSEHEYHTVFLAPGMQSSREYVGIDGHVRPKLKPGSAGGPPVALIHFDVDVPSVDIDIMDGENELGETQEDDPGGYVCVSADCADCMTKVEAKPVALFPDAKVKITIEKTATGGDVKVWKSPDGTGPVNSGDEIDPQTNPELYVQGVRASSTPRDAEIRATYTKAADPENALEAEQTAGDSVFLTVLKVELFRDEACTKVLDDWPAESGKPRSPKYVFGAENDISIRVTGPAGLGNNYFEIQVTSESDTTGIPIKLREVSSGIYRNDAADGELLRLKDSSSPGSPADSIKVINEEVLAFAVKASGTEVCSKDVKVDRAETGAEWQGDYGTYDTFPTLNGAEDTAVGFYDDIGDASLIWFKEFCNGDLASKETHFSSLGDSAYADAVDIVYWCGHGTPDGFFPRHMRFFKDKVGGVIQSADQLYYSEIDWGDVDADWVVVNTCRFLGDTDANLDDMASGVHLICGYETDMTVFLSGLPGNYFADQLELLKIRDAWHKQCEQYQPSGNTARVFGASDNGNETFQYGGPVLVARDPTISSTYTHWDYTKP